MVIGKGVNMEYRSLLIAGAIERNDTIKTSTIHRHHLTRRTLGNKTPIFMIESSIRVRLLW